MLRRCPARSSRVAVLAQEGLDLALESQHERAAAAVNRLSSSDAEPALADAILFDVGLLGPVEADADAARQKVGIVERALRVHREPVGEFLGHRTAEIRVSPLIRTRRRWCPEED